MARYPAATWRPIPEAASAPALSATQLVLHSAVGSGSLHDYFARADVVVESHLWVGLDGTVEQYVDTSHKADAQNAGNTRAISVETADNGHPDVYPWTAAQLEALAGIIRWVHTVHGIPIRQCPSWTSPGIGYHRLFPGEWNPNGHTCPGDARAAQFPALLELAQEDDMQLSDTFDYTSGTGVRTTYTVERALLQAARTVPGISLRLVPVEAAVAALTAQSAAQAAALTTLSGKIDQLTVGGIDLDALAVRVADLLAARLAS